MSEGAEPTAPCEHFWLVGGYTITPKDAGASQGWGHSAEKHDPSFLYCAKCLRTSPSKNSWDRAAGDLFGQPVERKS